METGDTIIPRPRGVRFGQGEFLLKPHQRLFAVPEAARAAELLGQLIGATATHGEASIRLEHDSDVADPEGYRLVIDAGGIEIRASAPAGFFYGAQSLRQLLPTDAESAPLNRPVTLPMVEIVDSPRFKYRGFMLDVSRHFFSVDEIKRTLDLLALQKINRFHWHLSDDQGWRIEIRKYPRLTSVGAWRPRTQIGGWVLSKPVFNETAYVGFYTQQEIREVVEYARRNFIEVIPEIDVPGHSAAAIAAYPELSCSGEQTEVRAEFTSFSKPLCVGNERVFTFLDDVFSEIAELFPFGWVHIGGDEVRKKEWKRCPRCRERVRAQGLASSGHLLSYFEDRLVRMLREKGLRVVGWGDILHDELDPNVVNQYWLFSQKKATIAHLRRGRPTIISDFGSLYLDYSYRAMELKRTYEFEPHLPSLSDEAARSILGVEAPLWTERVYSRDRQDWQLFPRLTAVSEIAWSPRERRDYEDFLRRLTAFEERLDALGVHHASRECYLKPPRVSKIPQALRILLRREHPAMTEYLEHHPAEIPR